MIRKLTEHDYNVWSILIQELWKLDEFECVKLFNELVHGSKEVAIGYFDDELVGIVHVSLRNDYVAGTESSPVGYIEGIVVTKKRRKEGIARVLVNAAKQHSLDNGCTEIGSDVEIDNETSIKFHKRLGFVEHERVVCFSKKI